MAKPEQITLGDETSIRILYEDRGVLAIDKPAGWMLAPMHWVQTQRNLQLALESSLREGAPWARTRQLKYLRHVHRLDAETSGVLILAKHPGVLRALSALFESREVEKVYLAVVQGAPPDAQWRSQLPLRAPAAGEGLARVDRKQGKPAETLFRVLARKADRALIEARPRTGRTHQIRVHLAAAGFPVLGDWLYGRSREQAENRGGPLALRAVFLGYTDPFRRRAVRIEAPREEFVRAHGFRLEECGG